MGADEVLYPGTMMQTIADYLEQNALKGESLGYAPLTPGPKKEEH